jgi:hypothetical protein
VGEVGVIVVSLAVWLGLCALVGRAAIGFHRRPVVWFLLAALSSPLAAYVVLLLVGDAGARREWAEREERLRRRHPDLKNVREAARSEARCPRCGAEVNVVTGDGLLTSEAEPWLLICQACQTPYEPD